MRSNVKDATLTTLLVIAGLFMLSSYGCSIFRATGEGVEAVGQGAGTAITGTGHAIVNGADDTSDDLKRAVR